MRDDVSDRELLERARAGEERAFRLLVERYEPVVASVVIAMLGPGAEAEDVGQETFIRFYRSLDRFRGDAALGTYLTRIAINLSLNARKRGSHLAARFLSRDEARARFPEPATEGVEEIDRRERERLVRRAIGRLDARHRAVVVLRMIEGYSTRETAAILDVPEGTVLSRLRGWRSRWRGCGRGSRRIWTRPSGSGSRRCSMTSGSPTGAATGGTTTSGGIARKPPRCRCNAQRSHSSC